MLAAAALPTAVAAVGIAEVAVAAAALWLAIAGVAVILMELAERKVALA